MPKIVVATFENNEDAQRAARNVREEGLRTDDISIVTKTEENDENIHGGMQTNANLAMTEQGVEQRRTDDVSDGILTGGVLGGIAGILLGAGTILIPGLGLIAAAGPITGILSGAVTGGIVGGLVDLGIPEEHSKVYEEEVRRGKVLFTMNAEEKNIRRLTSILESNGGQSIDIH